MVAVSEESAVPCTFVGGPGTVTTGGGGVVGSGVGACVVGSGVGAVVGSGVGEAVFCRGVVPRVPTAPMEVPYSLEAVTVGV
jgi:hypothetical protein